MPYTLTPKVRRRLAKVRDLILAEPKHFDMDEYMTGPDGRNLGFSDVGADATVETATGCGTTCCIAGWYHVVTPKKERTHQYFGIGGIGNTLAEGLGRDSAVCIPDIVHAHYWPEPFRSRLQNARGPKTRARVAAARIDHLLATGE